MKIIYLKSILGSPDYYEDTEGGRKYRRIVGGLAWPILDQPGFGVVLGEDFDADGEDNHNIYVLKEISQRDPMIFLRTCRDVRDDLMVKPWCTDTTNKGMMAVLWFLNNQDIDLPRFNVRTAVHCNDNQAMHYYFNLVRDSLTIGNKVLYLGEGSQVAVAIGSMTPALLESPHGKVPPIAALGYALAYLRTHKPLDRTKDNVGAPDYSHNDGAWML